MFTNADAQSQALPLVHALFREAHWRSGSRMAAYDTVAGQIDRSPNWVRKLIGRRADAVVEMRDWLNISAAYDRLCAKLESVAEHEEARAAALEEILHEAGTAGEALVERQAPPAGRGTRARRSPGTRVAAAALDPRATARGVRSAEAVSRG
ncbi:hypothetical protein DA075_08425 [Methylobacterium currus]|uniref:Uncharacterized protein n=1 Tax=Methylobacterium currus TaxID=2051553 RepID=A0A2R4WHB0_9HYPH|nr:hypothetical protein [Methylobacterium currus]AWB20932.1 hypothetical protein DA075_08425 [Methylobacterium currus]